VLASAQPDDLPDGISHMIEVQEHRIVYAGPRESCTGQAHAGQPRHRLTTARAGPPLVEFRDVTVRQGAVILLDHVTFTISRGEHWAWWAPTAAASPRC